MKTFQLTTEVIDRKALFEQVWAFFAYSAHYKPHPSDEDRGWMNFQVKQQDEKTIDIRAEPFIIHHNADGSIEPYARAGNMTPICTITTKTDLTGLHRLLFRVYRDELVYVFESLRDHFQKQVMDSKSWQLQDQQSRADNEAEKQRLLEERDEHGKTLFVWTDENADEVFSVIKDYWSEICPPGRIGKEGNPLFSKRWNIYEDDGRIEIGQVEVAQLKGRFKFSLVRGENLLSGLFDFEPTRELLNRLDQHLRVNYEPQPTARHLDQIRAPLTQDTESINKRIQVGAAQTTPENLHALLREYINDHEPDWAQIIGYENEGVEVDFRPEDKRIVLIPKIPLANNTTQSNVAVRVHYLPTTTDKIDLSIDALNPRWNELMKRMAEWLREKLEIASIQRAKDDTPKATQSATEPELTPLQKRIIAIVEALKGEYENPPDEAVASRLGNNARGQPYVRETINRERNQLRKLKIDV